MQRYRLERESAIFSGGRRVLQTSQNTQGKSSHDRADIFSHPLTFCVQQPGGLVLWHRSGQQHTSPKLAP